MIELEGYFGGTVQLAETAKDPTAKMRRLRKKIRRNARPRGDGAIVWDGNLVPPSVLEDAGLSVPSDHKEAYERHRKASNTEHAAQEPTPEQQFEMRSAFGEGKQVTNVITGQTYET